MQTIAVAGTAALRKLDELRAAWKPGLPFPFLVGSKDELDQLLQSVEANLNGFEDVLSAASAIDVSAWLREHAPRGGKSWPKKPIQKQKTVLSLYNRLTGQIKSEVHIGLIEVRSPHDVFAALRYGGWNDCPDPHIHVALHRYWADTFKATPVAISFDVVECFVLAPPKSRKLALELAREQCTYCSDIVEQGVGSIGKLGSGLLESNLWYFWWD